MTRKQKKYSLNLQNKHKFKRKYSFFAFIIIILTLIILYTKYLAIPIVAENTEAQLKTFATKSINYAVADTMNQSISYGEFVTVVKDSNADVSLVEANSVRINLLSKTISKVVMANFVELSRLPIKIALGAFSGISMFAGVGPKIAFDVNPYGEVYCYFTSTFESAGINQTHHKIYLNIKINVYVVLPLKKMEIKSESEVLLCETLIIGNIPEVYLNSSNLNEMLNLVPNRFTS